MSESSRIERRERRPALWLGLTASIGLAATALPAHAQNDVLGQMDRQVSAVVARVKPSVVSIQAGRSSIGQTPEFRRQLQSRRSRWSPVTSLPASDGRLPSGIFDERVGTGFVVDRDGTVLTTADVVGNTHQVKVKLWDGRELAGKVLGSDPLTGVAVVKVMGGDLRALRLAEQARLEPGQWAIVVGNQLDHADSVWVGTVARTDVVLAPPIAALPGSAGPGPGMARLVPGLVPPAPVEKLLQIDAPVGPGASGSPVLNSHGEVIGVVAATSSIRRPVTAAMPSDAAADIEENLKGDPDWQRQVQAISAEAQRIGQRAAEHARALSEQIAVKAKQMANEATQRSLALREQIEKEMQQSEQSRSMSDAERQRLEADRARQLEQEIQPQLRDMQRQLDQELKPLEEELKGQLESDLKPLQEQLQRLNETLPTVQGMREIRVDLAPQISAAIAQAHEAARAALEAAVKTGATASGAAVAPLDPPTVPAAPASPSAAPAAPEPVPGPPPPAEPGSTPAPPAPPATPAAPPAPHPMPAPTTAPPPPPAAPAPAWIPAAPPAPTVQFWAGRSPAAGASTYAIPAAEAAWAAGEIRAHGRVAHPYLGLQIEELRPDERARLKAPEDARVRVGGVTPHSPAQEAGLRPGDLILEFQGDKVEAAADLSDRIAHARVGERVSLVVWRDGERLTLHPTLRDRPLIPWLVPGPNIALPPTRFFIPRPPVPLPQGPEPRVLRIRPFRKPMAAAIGTGHTAQITLDAQDAELAAILRELSRVTGLQFRADGEAARQRITLRVERVPVDDLVESLERLYHLQGEWQGDTITLRLR